MHEEPDNSWRIPCYILSVAVSILAALLCVTDGQVTGLKQQAIQRGYAEYNQTTGQWQWKEKAE